MNRGRTRTSKQRPDPIFECREDLINLLSPSNGVILAQQDSPEKLAQNATPQPLQFLIPKFLTFFGHSQPLFRKYGVGCINHFVLLMPPALVQRMDQYMQGLFVLATDPSPDVRCCVCQALVMLLDAGFDALEPHMPAVIQYMLSATADHNVIVALEACEFWSAICETRIAQEALGGVLDQLIPVLLNGMVYSVRSSLSSSHTSFSFLRGPSPHCAALASATHFRPKN